MGKTDIKDVFRIIPIHPDDYKLLGFSWQGAFYHDKCLPHVVPVRFSNHLVRVSNGLCIQSSMQQVCRTCMVIFSL